MIRRSSLVFLAGILALGIAVAIPVSQTKQKPVSFSRDILPLLKAKCFSCHTGATSAAKLDLSLPESYKKTRLVNPKSPAKSVLMRRLKGLDGLPQMPVGFKPLTSEELALVETWISQGASTKVDSIKHWAYAPIKDPSPPKTEWDSLAQNPIDHFVFNKLKQENLSPTKPATKSALCRRVYLDLIGVPPTVAQLDAFLKDRSPNAYEKLVDSLLDSVHFGETQAIQWLDLARYADTHGYEKDFPRTMWPWRDWVISALNKDMPFDQFTIEQMAGDMVPHPTRDQLIASGFNRNAMLNQEGGTDPDEQLWIANIDRVSTTSTIWLGQTLQCAQCHNHKYDPFTMEDFYRFLAYFNGAEFDTKSAPDSTQNDTPKLDLSDPQLVPIKAQIESLQPVIAKLPDGSPEKANLTATVNSLQQELRKLTNMKVLIMKERTYEGDPTAPIRTKGSFLQPGQIVTANTPASLPLLPKKPKVNNRLALANWLVSPTNPLTARVQVNRIWAHYFGFGIVKTEENFGTQGEPPVNPELLDWLASYFQKQGWSQKAVHKAIVMSYAYRQDSAMTQSSLQSDPENRYACRGPRFRLPAETIRDNALAVGGILSDKIGGPSTFPDQPEGVWNSAFSGEQWISSPGEDKYRRGIYTYLKRSSPYPSYLTFDSTSREVCSARRIRTNTPLQSLILLNDPVFLDAAKGLASQMLKFKTLTERMSYGFRAALSRTPTADEMNVLIKQFSSQRSRLMKDSVNTAKICKPGVSNPERAATILVAQSILNLDEAITKE